MGIFVLITTVLVIIGLAFVLPPILGRGKKAGYDRKTLNAAIYRERLSELERQHRDRALDEAAFERARAELRRAALSDLTEGDSAEGESSPSLEKTGTGNAAEEAARPMPLATGTRRATALLVALALPVAGFGLYFHWGSLDALTEGAAPGASAEHASARSSGSSQALPPLEDMVDRLAARLKKAPDNPEGWLMLGRSYTLLGRSEEALAAFAEAWRRQPENPEILVSYAESLAGGNQGNMAGRPSELLRSALAIDPDFPPALWLAGVAAYQQTRYGEAITHWERLQKGDGISEKEQKMLTEILSEAREKTKRQGDSAKPRKAEN
uniref:Cytochrome c-type biogenesis protein CcmI n=1 Tax=Candidatus Kentrum sp. DK TaxID=2126562 RepID=A0A450SI22_9GAMM|nr:MAG: cytochrome c-type biogenesis protein CcmI [Candidatus Kentron sp. DK]